MEESLRLIKDLDLAPHPEGGWFRRTAESDVDVSSVRSGEPRRLMSTIYYLLAPAALSADEVKSSSKATWEVPPGHRSHFALFHTNASTTIHACHAGKAIYTLIRIPGGDPFSRKVAAAIQGGKDVSANNVTISEVVLGCCENETRQLIVPGGYYKRSELADGDAFCLISEVVTPAWHPDDHQFLSTAGLAKLFPEGSAAHNKYRKYVSDEVQLPA